MELQCQDWYILGTSLGMFLQMIGSLKTVPAALVNQSGAMTNPSII